MRISFARHVLLNTVCHHLRHRSSVTSTSNSFGVLSRDQDPHCSTPRKVLPPSKPNRTSLKIISINVNSLRGKTIQMTELLHTECPDIILCQETKVDQHISSNELFPKDFVTFRKDRNSAGGGVFITVNRKLRVTHCSDLDVSDLEAVWIQVHTNSFTPLYICSIYRPPDKGLDYIELLRKPLEALTHRHPHKPPFIIIGGDLNYPAVNWKSVTTSDTSADNLLDLLNDFYLQQLVNVPTRHSQSVSSILDLVLTSYPASIPDLTVDREFSDHCIVSFNVLLAPTFTHTPPRKFFLYNRGDYDQLRADLDDFQCSFFESYPDTTPVEVNWQKFKQALLSAVEKMYHPDMLVLTKIVLHG